MASSSKVSTNVAGKDDDGNKNDSVGDFPGTVNLLRFHTTERKLFFRLTHPMGLESERCKVVMALWMWFEAVGHRSFIRHVHSSPDATAMQFFREAVSCMECLLGQRILTLMNSIEIPTTSWLIEEPINLRFFVYHKDPVMSGIINILDNVCRFIFNDDLMPAIAEDPSRPENRRVTSSGFVKFPPSNDVGRVQKGTEAAEAREPKGKGKEADAAGLALAVAVQGEAAKATDGAAPPAPAVGAVVAPSSSTRASPLAWQPVEDRTAFITFARGQHMSREDVVHFFNTRYGVGEGKCVERVLIERELPQYPPMYGVIVFTSPSIMEIVLNGQPSGKFYINGRFLWARMCKPRPRRPFDPKKSPAVVGLAARNGDDPAV